MTFDATPGTGVAEEQICVVYDNQTGRVAHVHTNVTLEGATARTRDEVAQRAMELARELATQLPWVQPDRLELLHVRPEDLPDGPVTQVDVASRRIATSDETRSYPELG